MITDKLAISIIFALLDVIVVRLALFNLNNMHKRGLKLNYLISLLLGIKQALTLWCDHP